MRGWAKASTLIYGNYQKDMKSRTMEAFKAFKVTGTAPAAAKGKNGSAKSAAMFTTAKSPLSSCRRIGPARFAAIRKVTS